MNGHHPAGQRRGHIAMAEPGKSNGSALNEADPSTGLTPVMVSLR
ncbi:MAG TPA: hypothetical protein P5148_09310 [Anaerolineae bacterium]|nr:hypothetical protein [Anaerolineae bacterium]